ncbi:MAG: GPW/gp25 family protein [Chlorobiaceae bacterium]|nr:GPW/gp25 family protein [Chlorobiaceae bacterium]
MGTTDRSFLGIGWSFPPTFRREIYGVEMLVEEEDVRSSLQIILSTLTGERVMLPQFGANLHPFLFDSMNVQTLTLLDKIVRDALALHEPRIIVEEVVTTPEQETGILQIAVSYSIIATNTRYNYVFPFYINEATNITL